MFHCTSLSGISECVLKTMQLLELGRLEGDKGSSGFDTKTKSFQQRWFRMKAEKSLEKTDSTDHEARAVGEDGEVFIERDSLITLTCKRGKTSSVESYRVLALFTKHYKKWYPSYDPQRFMWKKNSTNVRCLVRMMAKHGLSWKDVELETNGDFGPSCIFCVCTMNEILSVESKLVEDEVLF